MHNRLGGPDIFVVKDPQELKVHCQYVKERLSKVLDLVTAQLNIIDLLFYPRERTAGFWAEDELEKRQCDVNETRKMQKEARLVAELFYELMHTGKSSYHEYIVTNPFYKEIMDAVDEVHQIAKENCYFLIIQDHDLKKLQSSYADIEELSVHMCHKFAIVEDILEDKYYPDFYNVMAYKIRWFPSIHEFFMTLEYKDTEAVRKLIEHGRQVLEEAKCK